MANPDVMNRNLTEYYVKVMIIELGTEKDIESWMNLVEKDASRHSKRIYSYIMQIGKAEAGEQNQDCNI